MSFTLIFWIIMFLWLLSWFADQWPALGRFGPYASNAMLFILFLLLGWRVFGAPIHG